MNNELEIDRPWPFLPTMRPKWRSDSCISHGSLSPREKVFKNDARRVSWPLKVWACFPSHPSKEIITSNTKLVTRDALPTRNTAVFAAEVKAPLGEQRWWVQCSVLPALKSQSAEAEQKEQQRKQHGTGGCPISSGEYIQLKLVHSSRPVTDREQSGNAVLCKRGNW